jgi:hypothetical protein
LPIPQNYVSAVVCRSNRLPVRADGDTVDGDIITYTLMTGQSLHQPAVSRPNLERSVLGRRCDRVPVRAESETYYRHTLMGCGQLLMYRYFRNSILIDLLPELFPPGFRERERTQA